MKTKQEQPATHKKTPVRFFLTEDEKKEVDAYIEPYGGNRGTVAKRELLARVRNQQQK